MAAAPAPRGHQRTAPAARGLVASLAPLLADWLPRQRWFAGKGRPISGFTLVSATELLPCTGRGGAPGLLHLLVRAHQTDQPTDGAAGPGDGARPGSTSADCYQLLLGTIPPPPDGTAPTPPPPTVSTSATPSPKAPAGDVPSTGAPAVTPPRTGTPAGGPPRTAAPAGGAPGTGAPAGEAPDGAAATPPRLGPALLGRPTTGPLRGFLLYEALADPRLAAVLLERLRNPGALGPLRFRRAPGATIAPGLTPHPLATEQSNSSVVYGDAYILKVFRRVAPGVNPDLEVALALARSGCGRVPAPTAWFEASAEPVPPPGPAQRPAGATAGRRSGARDRAVAGGREPAGHTGPAPAAGAAGAIGAPGTAEVPGVGTTAEVTGAARTVEATGAENAAETNGTSGANETAEANAASGVTRATGAAAETLTLGLLQPYLADSADGWQYALDTLVDGADFAAEADALGRATAEVHLALARSLPTTRLRRPQIERLTAAMSHRLDVAARAVPALRPYRAALRTAYADLAALGAAGRAWPAQRVHGDLHLGQALRSTRDGRWSLIDFEGEPASPLAERRRPQPVVRDIAGMLRSFDYAAAVGARGVPGRPADREREGTAGPQEWARRARAAYCAGYAAAGGHDPRAEPELLRAYETDKAVYEVLYEARHRPDWLPVPMTAIRRLAGTAAPGAGGASGPTDATPALEDTP